MTTTDLWAKVEYALSDAHSIAWDGCHKIYVLMDEGETDTMTQYGYRENDVPGGSRLYLAGEVDFSATVHDWWSESCGLRFINAVKTVEGDRNEGFTTLISQFENGDDPEDTDDEEEDE